MAQWLEASDGERTKRIVIVGRAPDAPELTRDLGADTLVVALNNAWRASPRYDFVIAPDDFPQASRPPDAARTVITGTHYVDAASLCGGHFWCGHTVALTGAYWSLRTYVYSQITFLACDMVYPSSGSTHFYGTGAPDPLRRHITLQNITGKSLRAFYFAWTRNSLLLNSSPHQHSLLGVPRAPLAAACAFNLVDYVFWAVEPEVKHQIEVMAKRAIEMERNAPFDVESSDWAFLEDPSAWSYVRNIDDAWQELATPVLSVQSAVDAYLAAIPRPPPKAGP
jgi:hypothetical protein